MLETGSFPDVKDTERKQTDCEMWFFIVDVNGQHNLRNE